MGFLKAAVVKRWQRTCYLRVGCGREGVERMKYSWGVKSGCDARPALGVINNHVHALVPLLLHAGPPSSTPGPVPPGYLYVCGGPPRSENPIRYQHSAVARNLRPSEY